MFVEHFDSRFGMSARPLCPHWLSVSLSHLNLGTEMAGYCCQKKLHDIMIGLFIGCRTWKWFKVYVLITLLRDLRMHLYYFAATTPHGLVSGKSRSWDGPIFIRTQVRSSWLAYSTYLCLDFHFLFHDKAKRIGQGNLLSLIIVYLCQQLTHLLAYWLTTLLKLERFDLCRKICKIRNICNVCMQNENVGKFAALGGK